MALFCFVFQILCKADEKRVTSTRSVKLHMAQETKLIILFPKRFQYTCELNVKGIKGHFTTDFYKLGYGTSIYHPRPVIKMKCESYSNTKIN